MVCGKKRQVRECYYMVSKTINKHCITTTALKAFIFYSDGSIHTTATKTNANSMRTKRRSTFIGQMMNGCIYQETLIEITTLCPSTGLTA